MDFRRSTAGLLGFTIDEAGVVQRVDGLAKISGLQSNSRLLQVSRDHAHDHTHHHHHNNNKTLAVLLKPDP